MPAASTKRRTSRARLPVRPPSVCLVSLGCSKNLVDTEVMAGHLGRAGIDLVFEPEGSDVVIVNTCGFIEDSRTESVDTIRRHAAQKARGEVRALVVTGCMVQLHEARLRREVPEVDAFLPLSDYSGVPSIVRELLGGVRSEVCPGNERAEYAGAWGPHARAGGAPKAADTDLGRALLTTRHTAYLRLGEGCNHVCAFCAIPKIRGRLRSKPLEVLVEEAEALVALGVVELSLIAEDTTDYGKDLKAGYGLADLLAALGAVRGLRWVRVLYAHPASIDERLVATLAEVGNVVPYVDMPIQHGDETILRRMRRGTSPERIRRVVGWLRQAVPGITLRTTILVGFPGETERRFGNLVSLLDELAFERVGCFAFSPERNTEAARLRSRVPAEVAEGRRARVMSGQRRRSARRQRALVGTTATVLVDAREGALALGRTAAHAPEVDGRVLLDVGGSDPRAGDFVEARITGVQGYDLVASLR